MNFTPKRRVLCVDDHLDTCALIACILSDFEVTPAHSKAAGLSQAIAGHFDLIILDHHLPDGTGLDLCKEIRRHDPITPILFFTGTTEVTAKELVAAGGQAVIFKTEFARLLPVITLGLFGRPHALQEQFTAVQPVT